MKIILDDFEFESLIRTAMQEKFKHLVGQYQFMTVSVEKPIPKITIVVDIKTSSSID